MTAIPPISPELEATFDASLRSWVESANDPTSDFPIQNLPFGVYRRRDGRQTPGEIGVAIGDRILSLAACSRAGLFAGAPPQLDVVLREEHDSLNQLMSTGRGVSIALRLALVEVLREGNAAAARLTKEITVARADAEMLLPVRVGNYTDFYASIHHATNVGSMFRPDNPLLPNYKYVPIGYHGRASSIVVSGTNVRRPSGQTRDDANAPPIYGPSKRLDYEMEVGVLIGQQSRLGEAAPLRVVEEFLWGVCLVNDWSARDIQSWEYQPLGPFLAKNFATSLSPWVVTMDALIPFRVPATPRPPGDPHPLPYLSAPDDQTAGGIDLTLEVWLRSARMRERGGGRETQPMRVSRGRFRDMYWTIGQMVTHHMSNGCNLLPGDLIASGTVSGPDTESRGCLLERTWRGTEPLELPTGERRAFLEDGDEVIMRGYAERDGYRRIGLGECSGMVTSDPPERSSGVVS